MSLSALAPRRTSHAPVRAHRGASVVAGTTKPLWRRDLVSGHLARPAGVPGEVHRVRVTSSSAERGVASHRGGDGLRQGFCSLCNIIGLVLFKRRLYCILSLQRREAGLDLSL